MKLKFYTSHLSVSSNDESKEAKKIKNNMINVENYIKRMILISMKIKKYLEKHDYFYEEEKRRKFDLKNIKIKPTPFQKYQKFKLKRNITAEKNINNNKRNLISDQFNNNEIVNKNKQNLITINNFNFRNMPKNNPDNNNNNLLNNKFFRTQRNFYSPKKSLSCPLSEYSESEEHNTITSRMNSTKFARFRTKSNVYTINANKNNKIIQTASPKNMNRKKFKYKLDKFPILDIFNYKNNLKVKNAQFKSRNDLKERKGSLPFF